MPSGAGKILPTVKERLQGMLPIIAGACIALVAIFILDRGVYVGSREGVNQGGFRFKACKYLFITGVAELPAAGGLNATMPQYPKGIQFSAEPESLYCRFVAR